ncbi:MAG: EI24 domain-containing protein [Desulfatiglandaceae bacterium]
MTFIEGIRYNLRGLLLGLKTPKLLFWGLVRFMVVILITLASATLILIYHQEILDLIWAKPASLWVLWLWYLVSWLLSLFLVGISVILSYLISQIFFSVLIMDHMSRLTEIQSLGRIDTVEPGLSFRLFFYLLAQEIPRTIIPVVLMLLLMFVGLLTPLGPVLAVFSSLVAAVFLAWDHTDLIPARQMRPFRERFRFLLKTIPFHLGFGIPFLIPVLNILILSFAPVGATLYQVEKGPLKSRPPESV